MDVFVLKKDSNVIGVTDDIKKALLAIEENEADEFKKFEIEDRGVNFKTIEDFLKSTIEPIEERVKNIYNNCSDEIQKIKLDEELKSYLDKLKNRSNEIKESCQSFSGTALKEIGNFLVSVGERLIK